MIVQRDRQTAELAEKFRRERFGFGRYSGRPVDHEQRNLQLFGEGAEHVAGRDEAEVDQNLAELYRHARAAIRARDRDPLA